MLCCWTLGESRQWVPSSQSVHTCIDRADSIEDLLQWSVSQHQWFQSQVGDGHIIVTSARMMNGVNIAIRIGLVVRWDISTNKGGICGILFRGKWGYDYEWCTYALPIYKVRYILFYNFLSVILVVD